MVALNKEKDGIVELLLENGANVNDKDEVMIFFFFPFFFLLHFHLYLN